MIAVGLDHVVFEFLHILAAHTYIFRVGWYVDRSWVLSVLKIGYRLRTYHGNIVILVDQAGDLFHRGEEVLQPHILYDDLAGGHVNLTWRYGR